MVEPGWLEEGRFVGGTADGEGTNETGGYWDGIVEEGEAVDRLYFD